RREPRLAPVGVEQPLERLLERPLAEVGEARPAARCLLQRLELERRPVHADQAQRLAACIQHADAGGHATVGKAHRGTEGFATIRARHCPLRARRDATAERRMTLEQLRGLICDVPDFPKPGIVFKDITPLLQSPAGFRETTERLAQAAEAFQAEHILAIESRGFIFGAALAHRLGLPMHLVRKRGKLPRESVGIRYELEYGFDHLEVHTDAIRPDERYL